MMDHFLVIGPSYASCHTENEREVQRLTEIHKIQPLFKDLSRGQRLSPSQECIKTISNLQSLVWTD
jgi:hypothetical protein